MRFFCLAIQKELFDHYLHFRLVAGSFYPKGSDSTDQKKSGGEPTIRSMSMNAWLNPIAGAAGGLTTTAYRVYTKDANIVLPGPANLWMLVDENPYSINDGYFEEIPTDAGWVDCPASYHNNACGINFCDGHAQIRKWTDQTVLKWNHAADGGAYGSATTQDFIWFVKQHTTARK